MELMRCVTIILTSIGVLITIPCCIWWNNRMPAGKDLGSFQFCNRFLYTDLEYFFLLLDYFFLQKYWCLDRCYGMDRSPNQFWSFRFGSELMEMLWIPIQCLLFVIFMNHFKWAQVNYLNAIQRPFAWMIQVLNVQISSQYNIT